MNGTSVTPAITLPHGFTLFDHQVEALAAWQAGASHMIWRWHRQAGKGLGSLALLSIAAFQRPGLYVHVSPSVDI